MQWIEDAWRRRALAAALAIAIALSAPATMAAEAEDLAAAEAVVRSLHAGLVTAAAQGADAQARFDLLLPLVRETHDLPYIAEIAIRRQWRELDAAVRERYLAAFERLSVMTYATRFASATQETFELIGADASGGGRIQVSAAIVRSEAEDIELDYLLQYDGQSWRIVNILADRVSDLALKRAEYQRVLSDGSIDDLIEHIESQAESL